MLDQNETIVFDAFQKRFGITLQKIAESQKYQTPDVEFNIAGNEIVAEIKTLEDALRVNLKTSEMEENFDGFFEAEQMGEDKTWSRVARAIEKASSQLVLSSIKLKAVILLNKDCAIIDDLDDVLRNYRETGKARESLPQGAKIACQNWKIIPHLIFWIDDRKNEFHVRFNEIPTSVENFFRERMNA